MSNLGELNQQMVKITSGKDSVMVNPRFKEISLRGFATLIPSSHPVNSGLTRSMGHLCFQLLMRKVPLVSASSDHHREFMGVYTFLMLTSRHRETSRFNRTLNETHLHIWR